MTIEDFNSLNESEKIQEIFEARMISEKSENGIKYQLFQIDNFYIESKVSLSGEFRRMISTFSLQSLPAEYAGEVLSIPFVAAKKKQVNLPGYSFINTNNKVTGRIHL